VEKPFLMSVLTFFVEIVSFLVAVRMSRARTGPRGNIVLLSAVLVAVTIGAGALTFFFVFGFGGPYRISDLHPVVLAALLLAFCMPIAQLIVLWRPSSSRGG
jgi:hypothetical protein